jgi:4-hydroxy-2-oxoheptanedioate aldolase
MKINTVKQRVLRGEATLGAGLALGSPIAAELMSRCGFDWILVDNQHGDWDDRESLLAFRSISVGSAMPMARVSQNDYYAIGRLLDRGAMGIVVPMVNSAAEAAEASRAVRYPPHGERSWAPLLAEYHGLDYGQWIDDQVYLAVQIETAQAVACAEEILAVPGIDGCWIGPSDLARSMGVDLNTSDGYRAHEAAILTVRDVCRKVNKVPGIAGDAHPQRWLDQGFLFVTVTSDAALLMDGAQKLLSSLAR